MYKRWSRSKIQIIIHRYPIRLISGSHPGKGQTFSIDQLLLILNITPLNDFYSYNIKVGHWRSIIFYLKAYLPKHFFFETERGHKWARGREREKKIRGGSREGDREREKRSRAHPKWGTNSPDVGLKFMNREIMTWAEVRCLMTEPPRNPKIFFNIFKVFIIENFKHTQKERESNSYPSLNEFNPFLKMLPLNKQENKFS